MSRYKSGLEFEQEFAEFLKENHKYDKTVIRGQIKGKSNARGSNVDVIAIRYNEKGKELKRMGKKYLAFSLMSIIIGIMILFIWESDFGLLLVFGGIISEGATLLIIKRGERIERNCAWVECKNLKSKANINQVRKMLTEHNDYKNSGDKEYRFTELFFASSSGFIPEALKLAEEEGVMCYIKNSSNQFELIKYWT